MEEARQIEVRRQNETVYYEAWKWIVRGILFNAPHSIREKYKSVIAPLGLGGYGVSDNKIGTDISSQEINLLDKFVTAMQSIPIPDISNLDKSKAKEYVKDVVDFARGYVNEFKYFSNELDTITGNVATRNVLLKLPTTTISKEQLISQTVSKEEAPWVKDTKEKDEIVEALKGLSITGAKLEDINPLEKGSEDVENWYGSKSSESSEDKDKDSSSDEEPEGKQYK